MIEKRQLSGSELKKARSSFIKHVSSGRMNMRISIVTNGRGNGSVVCERYEEGKFLLVYESDTNIIEKVFAANPADPLHFAKKTVDLGCEAIVTGIMQEPEFERVASEGITRYNGSGLNALIALRAAVDNTLPLFTDYEGGTGCKEYDHSECSCED